MLLYRKLFALQRIDMKIALISDIHSNVFALEAVIADIQNHQLDMVINLGDILYGSIAPKATYELLMEHNFITISGNQDRQIFEATDSEIDSNPILQFILDDLDTEAIEWLKSLDFAKQSEDMYICHGTPTCDLTYLLEDVKLGYPILRSDDEIIRLLNGQKSQLICCGHTHIPRTITLGTGQLVVNPGSVGLPAYTDDTPVLHSMENFTPHASYSIIEKSDMGWIVQHMKVSYDVQRAAQESKNRNHMNWVHFLQTGRKI